MDLINVVDDMRNRSQGEFLLFIHGAESASVPGAVAAHPYQQAVSFTRRANRTLFKAAVSLFLLDTHGYTVKSKLNGVNSCGNQR